MAKKITLEMLASMVQCGFNEVRDNFSDVREHMATKEDLRETREVLARAIKELEIRLSAYVRSTREEFDRLKAWMEDIDSRLLALEGKRGRKAA